MSKILFGLFLLGTVISSTHGACPGTAAECINKPAFDKLSQGDPSFYCEEGAKLAGAAQNCLKTCNFNEQDSVLQQLKDTFNQFCAKKDAKCPKVCDKFVEQTRCYDPYGGLDAIIKNITNGFHAGTDQVDNCNKLYWGRYCQKTQNCSFNQNLDQYLVQSNRAVGLGLAVCGSETLKTYLPYLEETNSCSITVDASIASKCNISCALANAQNAQALCSLLEGQSKCLEDQSVGCTDTARRYVLPRLNTYAIANKHLSCQIKFNGILVRTAGKNIDYISNINSCMLSDITPDIDTFGRLKSVFNRDTVVKNFCDSSKDSQVEAAKLTTCRNNFLTCATPQHKLLIRIEDSSYDETAQFTPGIGAFPADNFGMAFLYNWIPASCSSVLWSDRICVADADKPVITTVTESISTTTAEGSNNNGQLSSKKSDNFEYGNAGPALIPAALLVFVSLFCAMIM